MRTEFFTRTEARELSHFKFKQPYIRHMRVDRRQLVRDVRKLRLHRSEALAELRWRIKKQYEIGGWEDAYAMMRWYRGISIARGEYISPEKKRGKLSKGNVAEQKRRYREHQETKQRGGRPSIELQYDAQGKLISYALYNPKTGKFETRNANE